MSPRTKYSKGFVFSPGFIFLCFANLKSNCENNNHVKMCVEYFLASVCFLFHVYTRILLYVNACCTASVNEHM